MSYFSTFSGNGIVAISDCSHGTMKLGSVTAQANRDRFFASVGITPSFVVSAELVHGNIVKAVTGDHGGQTIRGADGLLTNEPNVFLSVTTADCLPIFIFAETGNVLGILHAGRRGLAQGIISNAIQLAHDVFGVAPSAISIGIGPGICQAHYEVKEDAAAPFDNFKDSIVRQDEKIYLDLKGIAQSQCIACGVPEKNIMVSATCTFEDTHYFSQRRDRRDPIEAMVSVIGRKSP